MTDRRSVLVLGDVMTDVVAHLDRTPVPGSDVPAVISAHGGGSAANAAAWLSSIGHPTGLIGCVGSDAWGDTAEADLSGAGVITHLSRDPARATGTCIVIVGPDGERTMLPDPGANEGLTPGDLPLAEFRTGRHLHLTAYTLLREGSRAAALEALALARRASMTVSVDASSAAPLASAGADRFLAWVGPADILFANEDEAEVLAGRTLTDLFDVVVVKRGPLGALAHSATGGSWEVPAVPARARDTTGAGDAFAGGFLGAWTSGRALRESLEEGASLASRAVAVVGGRP